MEKQTSCFASPQSTSMEEELLGCQLRTYLQFHTREVSRLHSTTIDGTALEFVVAIDSGIFVEAIGLVYT